jgi:hypothetical protein
MSRYPNIAKHIKRKIQMNQNEMPTFDVSSIPQEFSPLNVLDGGNSEQLYAGDDKLYVTFATVAVLNPHKSTLAGRPIHDDIDQVTIRTPGSQLTSIVSDIKYYMGRPVIAAKYRSWKSGQMQAASGTPLENFPFLFIKPSLIAELKYRNIFTVEQLAGLTDTGKQSIMGGHELCKQAADWIAKTKGETEDSEKKALLERIAALEAAAAAPEKKGRKKADPETPAFLQASQP